MARETTVIVTGIDSKITGSGTCTFIVSIERSPFAPISYIPASDLPPDVRAHLMNWLTKDSNNG